MDKKYLKENNLYEAHKKFMRLAEYAVMPEMVEEEGEDENNMPPAPDGGQQGGPGMPPPPGGDPGTDMGAGAPPQPGGDPGMDMGAGAPPPPGGDPGMGGDMPQEGGPDLPPPPGGDPGMDMGMGEGPDMNAGPEEEYDVIDVDQITNAQEKMNDKVNKVGRNLGVVDDRIEKLMGAIDKMETMIDAQNSQITDLKKELIKRNPTQTEKLNLRSLDSYPFNIKPDEYWKSSGVKDNYQVYSDNDESTVDEYEITEDDIDDYNENDIANSFNDIDDFDQNINKIFGLK